MSEESTESTQEAGLPQTEPTATESAEPSYYLSDGVPGKGDRPEWFKGDKYKSIADQAKAYTELEKMHGDLTNKYKGISGAPDQYEVRAPEGYEITVDPEDPVLSRAQEWAKENNLPQETFDGLMGVYSELELARNQAFEDFAAEQKSKIENFDARNSNINSFLEANDMGSLADTITTAEQMEQFEALLNMTGATSLDVESEGVSVPTEEEIHKLMFEKDENGRQIYNYDRERQAKVRKMWQSRVGKGYHQQQVG